MVVTPDQADLGPSDTVTAEHATTGYQNSATLTDSSGDGIGNLRPAPVRVPATKLSYILNVLKEEAHEKR